MKITIRTRLNGRLPDPQGKYRDEMTQEATVELDVADMSYDTTHTHDDLDAIIEAAKTRMAAMRAGFYEELNLRGGKNYAEM